MEISLRVLALVFYGAAMVLYVALEKKTSWNLEYTAIAIDLAVAAVMGLIPAEVNPFVALYPVFFATAFQWCAFTGAKGYVSATIFSTNNLKQTVTSFADYLLSGKEEAGREKKLEKALFYGGTLLYFHVGVAAGYGASLLWGTRSIWLCALPLLGTAALIGTSRRVPAAETAAAGAGR